MSRWPVRSEAERFWEKVDATGDCWEWTSSRTRKGYGGFRAVSGWASAHRWAYEHLVGPIPPGLQIDHLCRVRHCVNPDHMEPVTNQVNQLRGTALNALQGLRGLPEWSRPNGRRSTIGPLGLMDAPCAFVVLAQGRGEGDGNNAKEPGNGFGPGQRARGVACPVCSGGLDDGTLYIVSNRAGKVQRLTVATSEPSLPDSPNGFYRAITDEGQSISWTRRGCGG